MSKNIIIQIDGVDQALSAVSDIQTDKVGGGSVKWVPEDEQTLEEINVTTNGTHTPTNARGISKATVNVPTKYVTGKGSDGNIHRYSLDDEGEIHEAILPERIEIATPPTVDMYGNGANISFTGLTVRAYNGDGTPYDTSSTPDGIIPFEQLVFPVTVALYDPDAEPYEKKADSEISHDVPIATSMDYTIHATASPYHIPDPGGELIYTLHFDAGYKRYMAYTDGGQFYAGWYATDEPVEGFQSYTYDGRTVYYNWSFVVIYGAIDTSKPVIVTPYMAICGERNMAKDAWTAMYGTTTTQGGVQIPVQWSRPDDGAILETSFGIMVMPPMNES